jgi:hypothetical protein
MLFPGTTLAQFYRDLNTRIPPVLAQIWDVCILITFPRARQYKEATIVASDDDRDALYFLELDNPHQINLLDDVWAVLDRWICDGDEEDDRERFRDDGMRLYLGPTISSNVLNENVEFLIFMRVNPSEEDEEELD